MTRKKQIILSLKSPTNAGKKVLMMVEVNKQEFENKMHLMSKNNGCGAGAAMTEFAMYKAHRSMWGKNGYKYKACDEEELLYHFGTFSGDGIVRLYYENIHSKSQV